MRRIKSFAVNTALVVLSLTVALLLCEFAFRGYLWVVDPKVGPAVKAFAGAKDGRVYKYRIKSKTLGTNSQGFRDREFEVLDDEIKVVMLGDSLVAAMELPPSDTVPSKLDDILNSELKDDVRVFNLGITGYNASQNFATLDQVGVSLKPDVVVLNLCLNDADPVLRRHVRGLVVTAEISNFSDINLRTIVGSSYVLTFLKKKVVKLLYSSSPQLVAALNDPQLIINQRVKEDAWLEMKEIVLNMRDLAVDNDADFLVAIYPYASQIGLPPSALVPQRDLESYFETHGIASIDLAKTYENRDEDMFVDRSLHLSSYGAERVAETLAKEIRQRYLVDAGAAD